MHDYCQRGTFRFVAFFQHGAGDVSKWRSPNSFKNGDGRWVKDEGLWVVSLAILQLVRPKVSAWVNKALELLTSLAMVDMVDWKALIWSVVQRLEKIDTTNRWEVQRRSFKTSKRPRNERDKKNIWLKSFLPVSIVFLTAQAGGGGFESYPHCRMIWGGIRKACERWTYEKCCVFYVIFSIYHFIFLCFKAFPLV